MKRPLGVTILAILFLAAGIVWMITGLQLTTAVTFGPIPAGTGAWFWGWIIVGTGVALWAGGLACWALQPYGWVLGHFLAILGLIEVFFIVIGTGTLQYALASTAFPFLLLWYLNRPSVKQAFGLTDSDV